jgi:hypothetical protein
MRARNNARWIGGAAVVLMLAAGGLARAQDISARIINGTPTDDFESVGIVGSLSWGEFGSGTLISSRHVLTAGHCAELMQGDRDGTFELNGELYVTSSVRIHPSYNPQTLANDLAVLELAEDVKGVEPSPIYRDDPYVGQVLTLVGYGAGGTGETGQDGTFGVKMVGTTAIDFVTRTLIMWQFDSDKESDTAYGDSGGPNFVDVGGVLFVAGVTSGGTEPDSIIGDVAYSTRVDAFAAWIDRIVESGGPSGGCDRPDHDFRPGGHWPGEDHRPGVYRPGEDHRPGFHWPGENHRPGESHRPDDHRPGAAFRPSEGHSLAQAASIHKDPRATVNSRVAGAGVAAKTAAAGTQGRSTRQAAAPSVARRTGKPGATRADPTNR